MRLDTPWAFRLVWLVVPFAAGPLLADALDARSEAVRTVGSVGLWAGWAVVFAASLVPRTASLTLVRLTAPVSLVAAGWAASVESTDDVKAAVALAATVAAAALVFLPGLGDAFVNGSAYGPERRLALRVPVPLLFGPVLLAWVVAVAGLLAGPLLFAARQWFAAAVVTLIGVPLALLAVRSLHTLSRRWVVFVPGGMVLHDPLTVAESVLMPRTMLEGIAPARADSVGLDLTQRAAGLILEARLKEPLSVSLYRPLRRTVESVGADRVLFAPTKPAAVLDAAAERRIPT